MMKELLFLVHRIPYPPNKGDKIRSYRLLKFLSQRFRVHLGTFVDDQADWEYVEKVKVLCAETCFMRLDPDYARLRCLSGLSSGQPLSLPYYRDTKLQTWVDQCLQQRQISNIVVFSSAMAQYVESVQGVHRLIDFVDVDSDKWLQYAKTKRWPLSWLYRRESRRLLDYERRIAQAFDAATFVSEPEAALFKRLQPEVASKVNWFSNGVDTDYFSPQTTTPNPYSGTGPVLVFTGAMDYWANVDAVKWFAEQVFPSVRAKYADVRFYIVGARPAPEVTSLGALPGVVVTGTVDDVRPYVAHATLSVAPLRIARGIQNKVLEAMAMQKAVVASPQALEGVSALPGSEILVSSDAEAYSRQIIMLLRKESISEIARIARAARHRVLETYSWDANLSRIDALLALPYVGRASTACTPVLATAHDSSQGRPA